ncbi:MAG: iron-containing alcohol dehydrogenase [Acetobacterales bacterium]
MSGVFTYPAIDRIVWGRPAAGVLAEEAARLDAKRVFLVASGTMRRETGAVAAVEKALGTRLAGVYDRMPPHDPFLSILDASAEARAVKADLLVTFGGGSLTDGAKIMQICLRHDVTTPQALEGYALTVGADGTITVPEFEGPEVRQITVPTTLSGGEFNPQATGTDERIQAKRMFRHPLIVPRGIVYDAAVTIHTPEWLWLSSGMRAVDHCIEGICSVTANPVSDATCIHALKLLTGALRRCKADPDDLAARQDCQLGTWLSLAGRRAGVEMGASHGIGHVLGGTCHVPHGYTTCVMLPSVLRYNKVAVADRQALVAGTMGRPGEDAADVVEDLIAELGLPTRLSQVGVGAEQFENVAHHAMHEPPVHRNPRRIRSAADVVDILTMAA